MSANSDRQVGRPVLRVEDERFLTGRGRYVDDIPMPDAAHAAFLRSPHAHGRIRRIDVTRAGSMPGVLAVLTGEDWEKAGGGHLSVLCEMSFSDGRPMAEAARPVFVRDKVRHVGDTIAIAIADTREQAQDAIEAIDIDIEPLPAAATPEAALQPDATRIHESIPDNLAYDWHVGDRNEVERALASSAHCIELALDNTRIFHLPMEPRAALARYDPADNRYTLWTSSQIPHLVREFLATDSLKVPAAQIRVVAPDLGGGFGQKAIHYPEEPALLWAAKLVGRPVRWRASRGEAFLVDVHARAQRSTVRMGVDANGQITALDVAIVGDLGAYLSAFSALMHSSSCASMLSQCYAVPLIHARVRAVYTNTTPTDAYRDRKSVV